MRYKVRITIAPPSARADFLALDQWSDFFPSPPRSVEVRDDGASPADLRLRLEASIARAWRAFFDGEAPFPMTDGQILEGVQERVHAPHVKETRAIPTYMREALARAERERQVERLLARGAA